MNRIKSGCAGWIRTSDHAVNSRALCRLSYRALMQRVGLDTGWPLSYHALSRSVCGPQPPRTPLLKQGARVMAGLPMPCVSFHAAAALLIVALSLGCASASGKLVLTEDAMHDSLASVDDNVRSICGNAYGTPLEPTCKEVRQFLITAIEAEDAFNRAVLLQKPANLGALLTAIGRLAEAVKRLPGDNNARTLQLGHAVAAAYAVSGGK